MPPSATFPQDVPARISADSVPAIRPWSVMHATADVHSVLELAEAQRALGMRPVLVTPAGYGSIELYLRQAQPAAGSASLLSTWQQVRQWRKSLGDCAAAAAMEVLHAHCFAAGMSGVRNWPVVVYDLAGFVEHAAEADQQWLARSLRVAEQFVLGRAEAVVIHQASLRAAALERGAQPEHLFVIPHPLPRAEAAAAPAWRAALGLPPEAVTLFAAAVEPAELDALASAFAQLLSEVEHTVLLLPAEAAASARLREQLAGAGFSGVRLLAADEVPAALRASDIVLAGASPDSHENAAMLAAMRALRAVLAADTPTSRDVSPEGRGCLWYQPGNARDLAARASFLARNADLRRALGDAARALLEETRSPEAVARAYDAVYRHAYARRGDDSRPLMGRFEPLTAAF